MHIIDFQDDYKIRCIIGRYSYVDIDFKNHTAKMENKKFCRLTVPENEFIIKLKTAHSLNSLKNVFKAHCETFL